MTVENIQRCPRCGRYVGTFEREHGYCAGCGSHFGPPCPNCSRPLGDGLFQCVACEMTAEKPMRRNHEHQEIVLAMLQERQWLRDYNGRRHRRAVRNRLRKVNAKLRAVGLIE